MKYSYDRTAIVYHTTPHQLKKYLREHPKADPSKHVVQKSEGKGDKGDAKSESGDAKSKALSSLKKGLSGEGSVDNFLKAIEESTTLMGLERAPKELKDALTPEFKKGSPAIIKDTLKALGDRVKSLKSDSEKWAKEFADGDWEGDPKKEKEAVKILKRLDEAKERAESMIQEAFGEKVDLPVDLKGREKAQKALEEHEKKPWYKKLFGSEEGMYDYDRRLP